METTTHRVDGHDVHEHTLSVPIEHAHPELGTITVFAREIVREGGAERPRLVWFQGGPGHRAHRPASIDGWLDRALQDYRVVLLDQRGTGLSTPANRQTLPQIGDGAAQAAYLAHFRADSIVDDAEMLRQSLGADKWTVLGQSYGGFLITAYLSRAPHGLHEAMITAGLPALRVHADETYRATYRQTALRNVEYFVRYPQDEAVAQDIATHLDNETELLPTGERLSARRFRQLGLNLGSTAGFEVLHHLLQSPFTTVRGHRRLRDQFLVDASTHLSFAADPLYALMHETIYAQGSATGGATAWSAHRVRQEFPEFSLEAEGPPFRFTGEHIYPWQFEEDPSLIPLRDAAHALARRADFPVLYHPDVLAENQVPVTAAIYYDDMFVPREGSLATAATIRGIRPLITNAYQHDGLRVDGYQLLDRLISSLRR